MYILNFYYGSSDSFDEEYLYFSSLEKLDAFMGEWDKGIAEVEDKDFEENLCHYYKAFVLEVELDIIADPKFLYTYVRDKVDASVLCWRKVMPKE